MWLNTLKMLRNETLVVKQSKAKKITQSMRKNEYKVKRHKGVTLHVCCHTASTERNILQVTLTHYKTVKTSECIFQHTISLESFFHIN